MEHIIEHDRLPKPLQSASSAFASSTCSIAERKLREHLQHVHLHILEQYRSKIMEIYLEVSKTASQDSHVLIDADVAKLRQDQRSLPVHQQLNPTMMQLLESHLALITRKVDCIYNYETLQQ